VGGILFSLDHQGRIVLYGAAAYSGTVAFLMAAMIDMFDVWILGLDLLLHRYVYE
jgi:hypothetical protein